MSEQSPRFVFLLQAHSPVLISPELQYGLEALVAGALEVLAAHANDPERGDIGWRVQSVEKHMHHAHDHCEAQQHFEGGGSLYELDDDNLEHWKHAAARLALAAAKRELDRK